MGAWVAGPFDNDDASDWAYDAYPRRKIPVPSHPAAGRRRRILATISIALSTMTLAACNGQSGRKGSDDHAVVSRLQNAATTELTLFTDAQKFTDNVATLTTTEPLIKFGVGLSPPTDPAIVNVAISTDAQWACLIARSATGHAFSLIIGPHDDVYIGTTVLKVCSATAAVGLKRTNG